MATEITCVSRHRLHPNYVEGVGGPGWRADLATVLRRIDEGREYVVRHGPDLFSVCRLEAHGRRALGTDPALGAENHLLALPDCSALGEPLVPTS